MRLGAARAVIPMSVDSSNNSKTRRVCRFNDTSALFIDTSALLTVIGGVPAHPIPGCPHQPSALYTLACYPNQAQSRVRPCIAQRPYAASSSAPEDLSVLREARRRCS